MRGLKKNAARRRLAAQRGAVLLAWAWVGAWTQSAHADTPHVLVFAPDQSASGFMPALQIQLSRVAEPEAVNVPLGGTTAERIQRAGELVRARGALAAIWVDRAPDAELVVLYVVGERNGRALIEVVRVPGERGPDLDRTLALKVREVVAELRRSGANAPEGALLQPLAPADLQPPAAAREENPAGSEPSSWSAVARAGIRLSSQPSIGLSRWGVELGAGPALSFRTFRVAAELTFDAFPSTLAERGGDRVRYWDWAGAFALHAQMRAGPVWLGGLAGPQVVGIQANATTRENQKGRASPTSWALLLGFDAELPISSYLSVAAGFQLQALAHRLHLEVNDADLADFGRVRARLGVALVVRPFSG